MANRGKWKKRRRSCISITVKCRSPRHRKKFSGYFHFYRKHKDKFDRASKKYQLFTLYQIRNKRMTRRTLLTLLSVRNGKRLADGIWGALKMLEDLRANSWSLRPCCMVLAYRVAHFLFGVAQKERPQQSVGGPAAGAVSHYHRMLFSVMKSEPPRPLAAALLSITVTP